MIEPNPPLVSPSHKTQLSRYNLSNQVDSAIRQQNFQVPAHARNQTSSGSGRACTESLLGSGTVRATQPPQRTKVSPLACGPNVTK